MSTAFADTMVTWDDLLRTWGELEVPEGWRPEVTVEGIHMTPPSGGPHNLIADRVHEALMCGQPTAVFSRRLVSGLRRSAGSTCRICV